MSQTQNISFVQPLPFKFTGKGQEYFQIWIVNICLSIITLGIYSAWAKVRTKRYFYGNLWLDDSSFDYLAKPEKILKGRIIAVTLLIAYSLLLELYPASGIWLLGVVMLLFPFILVTATSFNMNNSAYRNIRFRFKRDYRRAYLIFAGPVLVLMVAVWLGTSALESSLFMKMLEEAEGGENFKQDIMFMVFSLALLPLLPYLDYVKTRFIIDHTGYGTGDARFDSTTWSFYKIYLIAFLAFMALGFLISMLVGGLMAAFGNITKDAGVTPESIMWIMPVTMAVFYGITFFITGYFRASRTNLIFGNIIIEKARIQSNLKGMQVSWIYLSNTIAIVMSLGLLIPWATVRMARYVAEHTLMEARTLEEFTAAASEQRSALGEEIGDAFDLDIGL